MNLKVRDIHLIPKKGHAVSKTLQDSQSNPKKRKKHHNKQKHQRYLTQIDVPLPAKNSSHLNDKSARYLTSSKRNVILLAKE